MKLIRLKAKGVATFEEAEIDFTKISYPLFASGHTGAGKTTFFVDAITAALYGKTYGEKTKEALKNFIMEGRSSCYVELEFEVNGKRYLIQRRISKIGASEAYLKEWSEKAGQWSILSAQVSQVNNQVEKLIGFNYDDLMIFDRQTRVRVV